MTTAGEPHPDASGPQDPGPPHLAAAAYVLHALPPAEEAAFENHLAGCAQCRREVDEFRSTTLRMADAEALPAPPRLRARVLDAVARTPQDRIRPAPRARRTLRLALAASLAAAAALGGIAAWQHTRADDARQQAATAREEARSAGAALADVLTAPDATIHAATLADGASAAVVVSRRQGESAFTASDLPALTEGKVYELWYAAAAGDLRPAGLLPGGAEQTARVLDGPLGDAVAVGITVEPAGGSTQPTTKPLGIIPIDT
ncbi:anti-sigma factor [Streptomyces genisteinicus]|uniref:Regulator of SigK n=1 Tax=Streptomyces genisteinicus TaxID=2768068 RepID=A0A7H0HLR9_9ACTN|nr:anti-sigma factor [Streptomyces genisteinicus]QNP61485.1 anti-sigma factor [Streptomyces genisteinicus]